MYRESYRNYFMALHEKAGQNEATNRIYNIEDIMETAFMALNNDMLFETIPDGLVNTKTLTVTKSGALLWWLTWMGHIYRSESASGSFMEHNSANVRKVKRILSEHLESEHLESEHQHIIMGRRKSATSRPPSL